MRFGSRIVWTAFVVLVLAFPSAPARAQEVDGHRDSRRSTVSGTVQLPPEVAKYPSSVEVTVEAAGYHQSTTTTPGGTFVFTEVPAGNFVVEVRSPGLATTRTEIRDFSGGHITVLMGKAATDGTEGVPAGAPTVSVRTLKIPEKAMKLAARAQEESDKQHFDKAVEGLHKALEIAPDFVEAWNNLGVTYLRMGKYKEAESALSKAVTTDPDAVPPLRNLGLVYLKTKRAPEALSVLQKARGAQEGKDLHIETYLGHALYLTGQYQEAEAVLQGAIKIKSDFPAALYPLGLAQVRLHEYEGARQTFTRFLQVRNTGSEVDVARSVLAQLNEALRDEERKSAE